MTTAAATTPAAASTAAASTAAAASAPVAAISKEDELVVLCSDVRIAVVGNVDSGKSTLIGVLTGGTLDNGRGIARARVFTHSHEACTGRTSAVAQHIVGFDSKGDAVQENGQHTQHTKTKEWRAIVEKSKNLVTLLDCKFFPTHSPFTVKLCFVFFSRCRP